jgi:hypothetical protein
VISHGHRPQRLAWGEWSAKYRRALVKDLCFPQSHRTIRCRCLSSSQDRCRCFHPLSQGRRCVTIKGNTGDCEVTGYLIVGKRGKRSLNVGCPRFGGRGRRGRCEQVKWIAATACPNDQCQSANAYITFHTAEPFLGFVLTASCVCETAFLE